MEVALMDKINSSIDPVSLEPLGIDFVYRTNRALFPYVYYNGLFFCEINPFAIQQFGLELPEYCKLSESELEFNFPEIYKKEAGKINSLINAPKGWIRAFDIINERIAIAVYVEHFNEIPDDQKYDAFINAYTKSESGFEMLEDIYHEIFSYAHYSQNRNERLLELALKYPDDKLIIYHGAKLEAEYNPNDLYSWTLSKTVAEFFAHRYSTLGEVWNREINIREAIDYLTDRCEEEILYDYKQA